MDYPFTKLVPYINVAANPESYADVGAGQPGFPVFEKLLSEMQRFYGRFHFFTPGKRLGIGFALGKGAVLKTHTYEARRTL